MMMTGTWYHNHFNPANSGSTKEPPLVLPTLYVHYTQRLVFPSLTKRRLAFGSPRYFFFDDTITFGAFLAWEAVRKTRCYGNLFASIEHGVWVLGGMRGC